MPARSREFSLASSGCMPAFSVSAMDHSQPAGKAFTPLKIGPLTLRNRFIKSATNEGMAKGGVPSKMLVEHHRRIAAGGVGMPTVAYCAVSPDGRPFVDQVSLNRANVPHLRALTDAVHRERARTCAPHTHGRRCPVVPALSA